MFPHPLFQKKFREMKNSEKAVGYIQKRVNGDRTNFTAIVRRENGSTTLAKLMYSDLAEYCPAKIAATFTEDQLFQLRYFQITEMVWKKDGEERKEWRTVSIGGFCPPETPRPEIREISDAGTSSKKFTTAWKTIQVVTFTDGIRLIGESDEQEMTLFECDAYGYSPLPQFFENIWGELDTPYVIRKFKFFQEATVEEKCSLFESLLEAFSSVWTKVYGTDFPVPEARLQFFRAGFKVGQVVVVPKPRIAAISGAATTSAAVATATVKPFPKAFPKATTTAAVADTMPLRHRIEDVLKNFSSNSKKKNFCGENGYNFTLLKTKGILAWDEKSPKYVSLLRAYENKQLQPA